MLSTDELVGGPDVPAAAFASLLIVVPDEREK
jgi:hypothetical protein